MLQSFQLQGKGGLCPVTPKQGALSLDPLSAPEPHHGLSRALAITPDPRSPGGSVAEWLACWTQAQKARVQISLPPGLWLTSPAGRLLRTGISSGTLRSVIYLYLFYVYRKLLKSADLHLLFTFCFSPMYFCEKKSESSAFSTDTTWPWN